jgi:trimeric autotransporter adhesin
MAFITSLAATVFGTANADTITTRALNGTFSTIYGGLGNDIYFIDAFYNDVVDTDEDVVIEAVGGGIDTVKLNMLYYNFTGFGSDSFTLGNNIENLEADLSSPNGQHGFSLTGNSLGNKISVFSTNILAPITLNGLAGNDTLIGGVGSDILDGGIGADVMQGGDGLVDKYYVDNVLDKVIETATGGIDRVYSSVSFTLGANVEDLRLDVNSGNTNATGNATDNRLGGSYGNNTLNGLAGDDTLRGYAGNDVLNGGNGDDSLFGAEGNDTLNGGAGNDELEGNDYNSTLIDRLDGGAGDDEYYIFSVSDIIADTGVGGSDTVYAYIQLNGDLASGIENLSLEYGSVITGRGNALNNVITGNTFNNSLFGLAGNDYLYGAAGNDILDGGVGNDTLVGGIGNDLMRGGDGNDDYFVDSASDAAVETNASSAVGGGDTVFSSLATYTLGANLENITLLSGAISATGNTLANKIIGNSADNTLTGGDGNDTLDGGLGAGIDSLIGGNGDDVFIVDDALDIVQESALGGTDRVESSAYSYTLSAEIENLTLIGSGVRGYGNSLANTIKGNIGNNTIDGGLGADTMSGGLGNDVYVVDVNTDIIIELAGQGTDTVESSLINSSLALLTNVENLTLTGAAINGIGNALNNIITGNGNANSINGGAGNDTLNGMGGTDTLVGGLGDDTYYVDDAGDVVTELAAAGNDTLISNLAISIDLSVGQFANIENAEITNAGNGLNITGTIVANKLTGGAGTNSLVGGAGDDTLNGGLGIDTLIGGAGKDVFIVDSETDIIDEAAGVGGGTDRVESSVTFSLVDTDNVGANGGNVENLTLTGTGNIDGLGNALANLINGNSGNNYLTGGFGLDTLIGGAGNDTLDGGIGADSMSGGAGDDIYYVDNALDKVVELAGQGFDGVYSSVTFTLGANVEFLELQGSTNINGTGNALGNDLLGNSGNNTLNGLAGNDELTGYAGNDTLNGGAGDDELFGNNNGDGFIDRLDGGAGDDTYYIYSASDIIADSGIGGNDTVYAYSQLTGDLAAGVENLSLEYGSVITGRGNALDNMITGNTYNNSLFGLAGKDTLDGGTGDDSMTGGLGDDTYYVDSALDVVTEDSVTGGLDTVFSTATFTLSANVENLTLTGGGNINGTGNTLNNFITGNANSNVLTGDNGDDTLDGGTGSDAMYGGNGSDTYYVDDSVDYVNEIGVLDGAIDTIRASVSLLLVSQGGEIENLILTGTANINGEGNGAANTITGNSGNNSLTGGFAGNDTLNGGAGNDTLNGGNGADSMTGGLGDDLYFVDNLGDKVIELAGQGTDTIIASNYNFSLALLTNIENLTLAAAAAIGTGNALNNEIFGNSIDNTLTGGAGNDWLNGNDGNDSLDGGDGADLLDGGIGNDTMRGGLGNDTYVVDSALDVVIETNVLGSGVDTVFSSASAFELGLNIENLTLLGGAIIGDGNNARNLIIGNANNNVLYGFGGIDTLNGGLGADTLDGGDGADIYYVDDSSDFVGEAGSDVAIDTIYSSAASFDLTTQTDGNVENIVLLSGATDAFGNSLANKITGNSYDNYLFGRYGNDTLFGGLGNDSLHGGVNIDSLIGGAGDDIYYVDNALDKVIELAGQGFDQVYSSSSFSLALFANVENLILTGTGNINGTGNAGNNVIVGNSFSNLLIGGYGNDTLDGGSGGTDTVNGGAGNDLLIGSVLIGGTGNDTYLFTGSETITEFALQGTDTIRSTAASSLSLTGAFAHIENAEIQNIAALNITGNGLNNLLTGNSSANILDGGIGADTLNGGFGADTLIGGAGNDVYIVLDADVFTEALGGGIDSVESSFDFSLSTDINGQEIENLTLTGSAVNGFGNTLNNVIKGNSGNNFLFGDIGNDTLFGGDGNDDLEGDLGTDSMVGGFGNDNYFVDSLLDKVLELAGQGTDTVNSNVSFNLTLNANIENVTLTNSANSTATGNALNNVLSGDGEGNNILLGAAGNDTLIAGLGSDTLTGGTGNDVFVFDLLTANPATITDFMSGFDSLKLSSFAGLSFTGAGFSLTANQFHLASAGAATIDTRIIYDQAAGALYYDADGQGGAAADVILQFTGITTPVLSSTDIFG